MLEISDKIEPIHPAATIVLVRDGDQGLEALLVQRSKAVRHMGGMWVFPGGRVDPDDAGWDEYLARTAIAARLWADRYPGPASDRWLEDQADWHAARERDRDVIGWSVWVARRRAEVP